MMNETAPHPFESGPARPDLISEEALNLSFKVLQALTLFMVTLVKLGEITLLENTVSQLCTFKCFLSAVIKKQ